MGQKGTRAIDVASRCQNILVNLQGKLNAFGTMRAKGPIYVHTFDTKIFMHPQ